MLNEKIDFQYLNVFIPVCGILFLAVMWGGFYFFVRFKRKDDAYRDRFQQIHTTDEETPLKG